MAVDDVPARQANIIRSELFTMDVENLRPNDIRLKQKGETKL
jgi:hypothetical protein